MSILSSLSKFDVLAPPVIPIHYAAEDDEEAVEISGESTEFNDPATSADVIGSSAELGGTRGSSATWDGETLSDADVQNLTGMSESPMTPEIATPNAGGSGQAGQQISSIAEPNAGPTIAVGTIAHSVNTQGQSLALFNAGAPPAPTAPVVLKQTAATGISLHANLLLFGFLGVIGGLLVLSYFRE